MVPKETLCYIAESCGVHPISTPTDVVSESIIVHATIMIIIQRKSIINGMIIQWHNNIFMYAYMHNLAASR